MVSKLLYEIWNMVITLTCRLLCWKLVPNWCACLALVRLAKPAPWRANVLFKCSSCCGKWLGVVGRGVGGLVGSCYAEGQRLSLSLGISVITCWLTSRSLVSASGWPFSGSSYSAGSSPGTWWAAGLVNCCHSQRFNKNENMIIICRIPVLV